MAGILNEIRNEIPKINACKFPLHEPPRALMIFFPISMILGLSLTFVNKGIVSWRRGSRDSSGYRGWTAKGSDFEPIKGKIVSFHVAQPVLRTIYPLN
jgi:hypothetical protein